MIIFKIGVKFLNTKSMTTNLHMTEEVFPGQTVQEDG